MCKNKTGRETGAPDIPSFTKSKPYFIIFLPQNELFVLILTESLSIINDNTKITGDNFFLIKNFVKGSYQQDKKMLHLYFPGRNDKNKDLNTIIGIS